MDIKYFKEKFIDWIDESNQLGIPATIQVHESCWFGNHWWGVVERKIAGWKFTTLNLRVMVELTMKKISSHYVKIVIKEFMQVL